MVTLSLTKIVKVGTQKTHSQIKRALYAIIEINDEDIEQNWTPN